MKIRVEQTEPSFKGYSILIDVEDSIDEKTLECISSLQNYIPTRISQMYKVYEGTNIKAIETRAFETLQELNQTIRNNKHR